jgi:hypothetical protein
MTDGLPLSALAEETTACLDATVAVCRPGQTDQPSPWALPPPRFAVTAIINVFDDWDYAMAAGPYLAEGIHTRQLREEAAIPEICRGLL